MMGQEPLDAIGSYFDENASLFDSRYDKEGIFLRDFINRNFRQSMYLRYSWVLSILDRSITGRNVLDVGCGSGRYCVALAKAGAERVVGVDISPQMLEVATQHAKAAGVAGRCDFLLGDFLTLDLNEQFDYSLATGFFDYVREPTVYLRKLATLTRQEVFASFPVLWHWLTPQRKLRYLCRGLSVYFYTKRRIIEVVSGSGLAVSRMERLGRDFVVSGVRR
jgi:ubiquinone/menaquinone biosynthesis C-methylase UbiE